MIDAQFDAPSNGEKELTVTLDYVQKQVERSQRLA